MKNKKNIKAFGILLLFTIILTWIIPSTTVGTDELITGSISSVGFADIFTAPEILLQYFGKTSILILFIGMFYGVINKSGVYKAFVDTISQIAKKHKNIFVIITVLFYMITTSLTGIYIPMLMFIPISIAILFKLKYSKVQAILATIGASTIGLLSQISNTLLQQISGVEDNTYLFIKIGMLVVLAIITILYLLKIDVKNTKEELNEEKILFVPSNRNAKKQANIKGTSLYIVLSLLFIVFVFGLTQWKNQEVFVEIYDAIKNVKIGNFAILNSMLGYFETFGLWTQTSLYPTIALAIIVISITNKLTFDETIEACVSGAKKVIGLAIFAAIINLILIFTLNSGFVGTIINFIAKSGNIALVTLASLISNIFMVDLEYAIRYVPQVLALSANNTTISELYCLILQFTYSFVMLIAPSSILLMIGLNYVEENYTKWIKYIWKLAIAILVICFIGITIAAVI